MDNSVVSVNIGGGLGNMMFQAAFAYAFSMEKNCNYELLNFDLSCYNNKTWLGRHGLYSNNIFKWFDLSTKAGECVVIPDSPFHYEIPPFYKNKKNIYRGYYQSYKYFGSFVNEVKSIYYPSKNEIENLKIKYNLKFEDFISLHVRRGDYISQQDNHPVLPILYYNRCIEYFGSKKNYLIFSDDIEWCKQEFNWIPNVFFVENELDFNSIYIMANCSHHIISNSSFSFWGAWLNHKEKQILRPDVWFGKNYSCLNISDIAPKEWKTISII